MSDYDIKIRLKEIQKRVERKLEKLLPEPALKAHPERRVYDAMRYSLFAGGKRLRPFLVMEMANVLGSVTNKEDKLLDIAAAIECMHTFALVHDDLPCMDDDKLRRGKPTCHVKYDECTAVLAGDALSFFSFEILAQHGREYVSILAKAAGHEGMIGGQMLDMLAEEGFSDKPLTLEEEDLIRLQQKKTGAMFMACTRCAALAMEATPEQLNVLEHYTMALGLLFQVTDDILDVTGSAEELGKTAGKDEAAGKATFVTLYGLDGAHKKADELLSQGLATLQNFGEPAETLRGLLVYIRNRKA